MLNLRIYLPWFWRLAIGLALPSLVWFVVMAYLRWKHKPQRNSLDAFGIDLLASFAGISTVFATILFTLPILKEPQEFPKAKVFRVDGQRVEVVDYLQFMKYGFAKERDLDNLCVVVLGAVGPMFFFAATLVKLLGPLVAALTPVPQQVREESPGQPERKPGTFH